MDIDAIVDTESYPLADADFRSSCRETLNRTGVIVMRRFLKPEIVEAIRREGEESKHLAYYCRQEHNVYLTLPDESYPADHTRNRKVISSKGCITDDVIAAESPLRALYDSEVFRKFLCSVLDETSLHEYADPLSSINLHYAETGQELGWHFDNSSFAVTLMIQEPEAGGTFEYVGAMRDADRGEMNFDAVEKVLNGDILPERLNMDAGALVLFRGRNAIHRVAPVEGSRTRMLVSLAYNTEPGISLSESARMTFFGRLN
jgi:hypothetical protein